MSESRKLVGVSITIKVRWDWFNWWPRIHWRYQHYAHWLCFSIWIEPKFSYNQ